MALDTKERDLENYNPGQENWDTTVGDNGGSHDNVNLSDYENDALKSMENNAGSSGDPSDENANIAKAKQGEETPSSTPKAGKSDSNSSGGQSKKQQALEFMKDKGPLGLILTLLFGGGGALSAMMFPGMALVQITESLKEDLNDSVASVDVRSQHIFRTKMKGKTSGFCSKSVSFRCKYKSFSKREIRKLVKAGFVVDPSKPNKLGRFTPKTIKYRDSSTGRFVTVEPNKFSSMARTNMEFRSKLFKAYNPRFASFRDKVATNTYKKLNISLKRALSGTKDKMKKQMKSIIKGDTRDIGGKRITRKKGDDGKYKYYDQDGNRIPQTEIDNLSDEQRERLNSENHREKLNNFMDKSSGVKSMLGRGLRGFNLYTGAQQQACMLAKMLNVASLAAKNIKFVQLARYASVLFNTSASIKTGDATMEAVRFMGDKATHIDLRDKVFNEETGVAGSAIEAAAGGNKDMQVSGETGITDNPHKGENAFDSAGYKLAAYGEVPNMDLRQQQFSLGGGMSGAMAVASNAITSSIPGGVTTCDFYGNPLVQIGGLLLSLATVFGTAGSSIGPTIAKVAAMTIVTSLVTAYVQSMIDGLVNNEAVGPETKGIDAGNAWFSGSAAMMGSVASSRGLNPLSTDAEIKESQRIAFKHKQQYYELARYEAQDTPFDVYNKFSFFGSIVHQLYPIVNQASSTASLTLLAPLTYLSTAFGSLSPTAGAATTSPLDRFQKCNDPTFEEINMHSADVMCNIRFGNSSDELHADPESVVDWMIDARQIDPKTGEALTNDEAVETIKKVPVTGQEVAAVLDNIDDGIPPATKALVSRTDLSKPAAITLADAADENIATGEEPTGAVENVRTYAHWLRFCRFGVEGGRTVNFGDNDGLGGGNVLTGISDEEYVSDGRECLKSNACEPGQNPNGETTSDNNGGTEDMEGRCRPPQYSIYSIFQLDKMDIANKEEESATSSESETSGLVTGEAKELAKKLAENPNIVFVDQATKADLLKFAETGQAINSCGDPFSINPLLSGALLAEAKNYKILVNNIGFQSDRNMCDSGQHPKGNAVDINGLKKLSGGETNWGNISFSGGETAIITDFTVDWMNILASKDPARGGVGQLGCGGFNITTQRDPKWKGPDGNLHFNDACNHLHIDVRDRNDNTKI